jgi:hypothetical protein
MKFKFEGFSRSKQKEKPLTENEKNIIEDTTEDGPAVNLERVRSEADRLNTNLVTLAGEINRDYGSMEEFQKWANSLTGYGVGDVMEKRIDRVNAVKTESANSSNEQSASMAKWSAVLAGLGIPLSTLTNLDPFIVSAVGIPTAMTVGTAIIEKIKAKKRYKELDIRLLKQEISGVQSNEAARGDLQQYTEKRNEPYE